MKIKAAVFSKKRESNNTEVLNKYYYLCFLVIFSGLICGVLLYAFNKNQISGNLFSLFTSFFTDFSNKSSLEIISGLLLSAIFYWSIMFASGCCLVGMPGTYFFTFVKSMAMSLLLSFIYNEYSLSGIEYTFLVLAPGKITSIFGMLIMCYSCLKMNMALKEAVYNKAGECKSEFRKYIIRSAVSLLIFIIAEFINFITIRSFSSLFSF